MTNEPAHIPPLRRNALWWLSLFAWLALLTVALWMAAVSSGEKWSPAMQKHSKLGFHTGGNSPLIAIELTGSGEVLKMLLFQKVDRDVTQAVLHLDFGFIVCYVLLFVLLTLRHRSLHPGFTKLLFVLTAIIAVCDVAENLGTLNAVAALNQELSAEPKGTFRLLFWSMSKWTVFFTTVILIGWLELGLEKLNNAAAFLRVLIGLMLITRGIVGLCSLVPGYAFFVETGFKIILLALFPFPQWLLNPDGPWLKNESATAG